MPHPRPPYLQRETTRHDKTVWYVRRERHGISERRQPQGRWPGFLNAIARPRLGPIYHWRPGASAKTFCITFWRKQAISPQARLRAHTSLTVVIAGSYAGTGAAFYRHHA